MTATKEIARLFGDLSDYFPSAAHVPGVKIQKNTEEYKISMLLPGVKKEDLEIKVEEGSLVIGGKRNVSDQGYETVRSEIVDFSEFRRALRIREEDFDLDRIDARLNDGILEVRLPLAEQKKPRQIAVKVEG
ncbi:MAG: Hsp20/alpha crystallin family protein [Spirochaetales bacterium]|nr:Hsp20/alpha crystallin family protein [Spirochaetales bacterium]